MPHVHREQALALRGRGQRGRRRLLAVLAEELDVAEEERPVLHDRAAHHAAELVAVEERLLAVGRLEEAGGVEVGAAHEVPGRAAEGVGAAGVGHVDGGAGRAAVLRAHVVGDHLELGHRVGRGLHHLVREALVARAVGVVVDAVDQEVVEGGAQAVDVERAFARREAAGVERRQAHAGREQRELRVLAAVERQGARELAADHLAAVARVGLQLRGRGPHLHLLGELAHGHRHVHAQTRADRDLHVVDDRHREAGLVGGHHVAADAHVEELVVPLGVGGAFGGDAGVEVGERDARVGHDGRGAVAHGADDGGRLELGKGVRRRRGHGKQSQQAGNQSHESLEGQVGGAVPGRGAPRISRSGPAERAPRQRCRRLEDERYRAGVTVARRARDGAATMWTRAWRRAQAWRNCSASG